MKQQRKAYYNMSIKPQELGRYSKDLLVFSECATVGSKSPRVCLKTWDNMQICSDENNMAQKICLSMEIGIYVLKSYH